MIRGEVKEFVALGRFPDAGAEEALIRRHEEALAKIEAPVTLDEARALLECFGPDDCCGLAQIGASIQPHPSARSDRTSSNWARCGVFSQRPEEVGIRGASPGVTDMDRRLFATVLANDLGRTERARAGAVIRGW
jgi:hypothetical protein